MKTIFRNKIRLQLLPVLLLLVFAAAGLAGAEQVHADALIWYTVNMKPGDTYDVSNAKKNTTVFIDQSGSYTIKGESRYVRVLVQSGGVDLYLADGLNINCGVDSYCGSCTAPIWVKDKDGTIKIISQKGADVYLEGYMCPAIRKEGTKSKLVFETEDVDQPGTITAKGGIACAGIGSVPYADEASANTMGNITINSGNIIAKGVNGAAGIGGAHHCDATDITINGGNIKAYSYDYDGAAIGSGAEAAADGIIINGGTVYAEAMKGTAIGSGTQPLNFDIPVTAKNIIINGGTVTAKNQTGGATIGSGSNGGAQNIQINGGSVTATNLGAGPAIGCGTGSNEKPRTGEVKIRGGFITAEAGGTSPGIGAGKRSGQGDYDEPGENYAYTEISGGTIVAKGGPDADSGIGGPGDAKTVITGGSINTDHISGTVVNGDGENVHRIDVTFKSIPKDGSGYAIKDLNIGQRMDYGLEDVYLFDVDADKHTGMFYPWLSGNASGWAQAMLETISATSVKKTKYYGDLSFTDGDTDGDAKLERELIPGTDVELRLEGDTTAEAGSAVAIPGENHLFDINPNLHPGTFPAGYYLHGGTKIADENGNLEMNVAGYTDEGGRWNYTESDPAPTLYCRTQGYSYKVKFNGNKPRGASKEVSGSMSELTEYYDQSFNLPACQFVLPGYRFKGWNTRADGRGTDYENIAREVKDLAPVDLREVTLYAQWEALRYDVKLTLVNGDNTSSTYKMEMTFDQSDTLPTFASLMKEEGWELPEKAVFHGWNRGAQFGNFYADGAQVFNLCTLSQTENGWTIEPWTLDAEFITGEKLTIATKENGKRFDVPWQQGENMGFHIEETDRMVSKSDSTGTYTIDLTGLNPGTYHLTMDSDDYVIPADKREFIFDGKPVSINLDYYTVTIDAEDHITSPSGGTTQPTELIHLPVGAKINVSAAAELGYHFDGYSVTGVPPEGFVTFDPQEADQSELPVRGEAKITAHAAANVYTVKFDPNGNNVTGTMADQYMVYNQSQDLFANRFKRTGGTFTGWNTKKDGSGDAITDKQSVKNLTTEQGYTVTLYAQWDMEKYAIDYDLADGTLPSGKDNPTEYTAATPTFKLNAPEKEDHEFTGWVGTDLKQPAKEVTIEEGSTGDRDYAALWKIKQFTVTFVENGGTGVEEQIVQIHKKAQKPENPTREGYAFGGWYADKGLTKAFDFNMEITEDTAIYAKWNRIAFNISYDLDGGVLPEGETNPNRYREDSPTFTLNNPVREDYDFTGWTGTGLSEPTEKVTIEKGSAGDRAYTATWAIRQFKVTFEENGGTGIDEQIVKIHQKAQKPEDPTREGCTFQGWYADQELTMVFDFDQEITKDTTIYAKWKENTKPVVKSSGVLLVKMKAKGKRSMTISWNKVRGATGYDIFFGRCGGKAGTTAKKVKTIKAGKNLRWTRTGLKKKTAYKAYVKAFKVKNGKKKYIKTSPLMRAYTSGGSGKYTNARAVKVNKVKVTLKKGKTFRIKAKVLKLKKGKKLMRNKHVPLLRYLSSDKKVATVSKAGKITAKAKGTCRIYVYAHNGVRKTIKITVK